LTIEVNKAVINLEQVSPNVWRTTLDSPGDRNALSGEMRQSLLNALEQARAEGAKVMIVRGDDRAFSSGYKLDPGLMRPTTLMEDRRRLVEVTEFMREYRAQPVVTIAEVRGYCVAGGTDLMLASDIAMAADDASIGVPNVRGLGITMLLPVWSWLMGPQRAKLLALTGDYMTGEEAARFGLVAGALPADVLSEKVLALAERITLMPQELLEVTKQALNVAWDTAGLSTTLLRAAELDSLSHGTRPVIDFWDRVEADGMRAALKARDGKFRNGRTLDLIEPPQLTTTTEQK
jgi:enoyl-CoA hydratase